MTYGRMQFEFYQRVLERYYKKRIQEYCDKKIDYVLVIRGEYTPKKTVQYLRKMFPETKLILYMWDGLNKRNTFGIEKKWNLSYAFLITKFTIRKARLIRRPVYIRGKKSLAGCRGLTTGYNCRFDLTGKKQTLFIGDNCEFGDMTHIVAFNNVMIGDNVLMASKVFVSDTNHGFLGGYQLSMYST